MKSPQHSNFKNESLQQLTYSFLKLSFVPQNTNQSLLIEQFQQLLPQQIFIYKKQAYFKIQIHPDELTNKLTELYGQQMNYDIWNAHFLQISEEDWNDNKQLSKIKFEWMPIQPNCIKQKETKMVCVTENCSLNPFICQIDCECYIGHKKCNFANWQTLLEQLNEKIIQKSEDIIEMLKPIQKIFTDLIEDIEKQYNEFKKWKQLFGLKVSQCNFVQLGKQQKFQQINGNLISKFYSSIINGKKQKYIPPLKPHQIIQDQKNSIFKTFQNLKTKLKLLYMENAQLLFTDSQIIQISQSSKLIASFFTKPIQKLNLLYRASDNNFLASNFHKKCQNIPHTLTILQTQYGKIIGGYTPISWKSTQGHSQQDLYKQSFLFSLTLKQKMPLVNSKNAVYHYNLHGPAFGAGNDLFICDKANIIQSSYCNFPVSYNSNSKYENRQQTYELISGQKDGKTFKIKEWQVYEIKFK